MIKFAKPAPNEIFTITADAAWPTIQFATDAAGPHSWTWTVEWKKFKESKVVNTPDNTWDAKKSVADLGGTLTVVATAGSATATIVVKIEGTNPTRAAVVEHIPAGEDRDLLQKIVEHESKTRHFTDTKEPLGSFDGGFGLCQLTNPAPTFPQVWNWKKNIDAGVKLLGTKRSEAKAFLGKEKRTYTDEQLQLETVCRWNGGTYHEWDDAAKQWVRAKHILCDTKTGNIGWDMRDAENKGKTEAELHKRDSASYSKPPTKDAHWKYIGVCYADRVLK